MKVKGDFVTNSSSTSYTLSVSVDIHFTDEERMKTITFTDLKDYSMKEVMDLIERTIPLLKDDIYFEDPLLTVNEDTIIIFNCSVDDLCCDGWDGGDYEFSGNGRMFYGNSAVTTDVMTKEEVEIQCQADRILWPEHWEHQGAMDPEEAITRFGVEKAMKIFSFDHKEDFIDWIKNMSSDDWIDIEAV